MKDLEKILENLPKPKLSLLADLKLKLKLYYFMLTGQMAELFNPLFQRRLIFRNSLAALLIIIIVFSGTSIYAYTSTAITPGHGLYSLKRAVEEVEQQAALTDYSKARTFQKFSERRLEEALHLSERHLPENQNENNAKAEISGDIGKNIDEAVKNITSAADRVKEIKDEVKAEAVKSRLKENENKEINYLDEIEKNVSPENDARLMEKINQARETISQQRQALEERKNKEDGDGKFDAADENEGEKDNASYNQPRETNNGEVRGDEEKAAETNTSKDRDNEGGHREDGRRRD